MMTRRRMIAGLSGSLLLGEAGLFAGHAAAAETAPPELVALSQKKPLIKRTFRPPNFETPLADLRSEFTANDAFFVRYHLAQVPEVDVRKWRLRVVGAGRTQEWSLDDLKRGFESVSIAAINQCSGNRRGLFSPRVPGVQWSYGAIGNALWTGVRLRDVLRKVGVAADSVEVVFDGADAGLLPKTPDFVKSLPVERALDENTLLAFEMNGQPLPHWNGAPARLVVPGWTATYWVKHLTEIRIVPKPYDGFWMQKAYRVPTNVFPGARFQSQERSDTTPITEMVVNSLVTSHESGARLRRGRGVEISGWAWDNGAGIAKVEFSLDGGRSWRDTTLGRDLGRFAWRGFSLPLDTTQMGPINISVRATSRDGTRQTDKLTPNPSGYHHNLIQTLQLEVV
ncbi:molybdopterin-dependent oxidoreductase [Steroidobacter sp. S1-65]|uniref:Molybdopterin-dependent oxidoreductase n=1 Tax=Steroidobacter gossypii TaxID=2805490 RepID=A0ABS1WV41_9GAMM|nr:molybdopterin-dependent oxidoreductase [Steroidobacter gossypii]MBM0104836.1 molybdopterin-dependent oxidoreductase [Steroidobacter gossypii]